MDIPLCRKCNVELDSSNWYPSFKKKGNRLCKQCMCVRSYLYQKQDSRKQYRKKYYDNIKLDVISHYSPMMCCVKCGEANPIVLSIDHVNGGGLKHFKDIGYRNITYWLKRNNYPDGYQVLCINCNVEKSRHNRHKDALTAIAHYSNSSNSCKRCGNKNIKVLSIDHINGDGYAHRLILKNVQLTSWLRKHNYPSGYQVLCMNCQWIKRHENNEVKGAPHSSLS